jgi:hypothetical protein
MTEAGGSKLNISESVDAFCQKIWDRYEEHPAMLPAEVTLNNVGTGIIAKVDQDGLFFEANGEEFDIEEWFMQNNFASDTLQIQPIGKINDWKN